MRQTSSHARGGGVDGAGAAALKAGYGPDAPALLAQRCQRHSVFWLQVLVSRSHLRTLPLVRVLHFRFETAWFIRRCRW